MNEQQRHSQSLARLSRTPLDRSRIRMMLNDYAEQAFLIMFSAVVSPSYVPRLRSNGWLKEVSVWSIRSSNARLTGKLDSALRATSTPSPFTYLHSH